LSKVRLPSVVLCGALAVVAVVLWQRLSASERRASDLARTLAEAEASASALRAELAEKTAEAKHASDERDSARSDADQSRHELAALKSAADEARRAREEAATRRAAVVAGEQPPIPGATCLERGVSGECIHWLIPVGRQRGAAAQ
jgi:hypothetical protein